MAACKYPQFLSQTLDRDFDAILPANSMTPYSGIYRCEGCGTEIVSAIGEALPTASHHRHSPQQGMVRWRLIVEVHGQHSTHSLDLEPKPQRVGWHW